MVLCFPLMRLNMYNRSRSFRPVCLLSATHFPGVCAAQSVTCHIESLIYPVEHLAVSVTHIQFCMPPIRPSSHPESVVDDTAVFSRNTTFGPSAIGSHSILSSPTYTPDSRAAHTHSFLLEWHTSALLFGPPCSNAPVSIEGEHLEQPFFKQIADDYASPFIHLYLPAGIQNLAISAF